MSNNQNVTLSMNLRVLIYFSMAGQTNKCPLGEITGVRRLQCATET
jgi:hypothetical protein